MNHQRSSSTEQTTSNSSYHTAPDHPSTSTFWNELRASTYTTHGELARALEGMEPRADGVKLKVSIVYPSQTSLSTPYYTGGHLPDLISRYQDQLDSAKGFLEGAKQVLAAGLREKENSVRVGVEEDSIFWQSIETYGKRFEEIEMEIQNLGKKVSPTSMNLKLDDQEGYDSEEAEQRCSNLSSEISTLVISMYQVEVSFCRVLVGKLESIIGNIRKGRLDVVTEREEETEISALAEENPLANSAMEVGEEKALLRQILELRFRFFNGCAELDKRFASKD